jgi:1-aminocyclopropane-1-carboxylate deaminase/D-cysteine desulfhydrase-like pyridoxal-dependent ACC family enzyme
MPGYFTDQQARSIIRETYGQARSESIAVAESSGLAPRSGTRPGGALDHLLGARVISVDRSAHRRPTMERVADELREKGRRPYVIPTGGSNGIGAAGYANALDELEAQARALGVSFDAVVFCSGSGGTHGGS